MRSKLTKVKPTDMTTLISAYESDDDDDDDDGSLAIETGASTIHSSIASVSTAVIDHQDIITTTTTDEPRKKQRCIDAIPPFPPSVKPAANTVENIKYYMDAMKRHDFRLIDNIRSNKEFRNPYILRKIVDHFKIDECGSNYPPDLFDPTALQSRDFDLHFKRRLPVYSTGSSCQPPQGNDKIIATGAKPIIISETVPDAVPVTVKRKSRWA